MKVRLFSPTGLGVSFLLVALLVVSGLGWVTVASLRVEAAQREATVRADRANQERLALWRLDGYLLPSLGLENNRPFAHYTALHAPYPAWDVEQDAFAGGAVQLPSPLLSADLPPWMLIHFQLDPERGWESPQVIPPELSDRLQSPPFNMMLANVTPRREQILTDLRRKLPTGEVLRALAAREQPNPEDLLIVPVPLADEPSTPKPPGVGPDDPAPGQFRPGLPPTSPPGVIASVGQERRSASRVSPGLGRTNMIALDPAASQGSEAKSVPAPLAFEGPGGGMAPAPPPPPPAVAMAAGAAPGTAGGIAGPPVPSGAMQQATPGKPGEPRDQTTGEAAARAKATQRVYEQRGGYDNTSQLAKNNPALAEKLPPAPGFPPAGPPAPRPALAEDAKDKSSRSADPRSRSKTEPTPPRPGEEGDAARKQAKNGVDLFERWPFAGGMRKEGSPPPTPAAAMPAPTAPPASLAGPGGSAPPRGAPPAVEREAEDRVALARELAVEAVGVGIRKVGPSVQPVAVHVGPLRPHWLTAADGSEVLLLVRAARLENKTVYQGVLLDWLEIRRVLGEQIADLFPAAMLAPVRATEAPSPERAMTTLPVVLDPGPAPEPPPVGWSPLRIGLLLAWGAALLALIAFGVGGRALVDLSERRIRFVSAVTHELRTPLTSLRLYLDLLTSGMIEDEEKRKEYLQTLATESERLNRLIENVLDFARLEKRSVQAVLQPTSLGELLEQVRQTWADRCAADGKELVVLSTLPAEQQVTTDLRMAAQVLGNLVDNARKYTKEAVDHRIWVWAKPGGRGRVVLEVEDRGPGVPPSERGSIFRPFRRGHAADTLAGGAGLGLALAKHWADLLGGTLSYRPADGGVGACFRLELPTG